MSPHRVQLSRSAGWRIRGFRPCHADILLKLANAEDAK